ncbi:MAG TPA: adenine phosphoribosyltransferase [Papillibacter sp.]|jgi:adenine phosphoribosyltransferase|nr:adenine phosphoribosyltransferase [Papillibacter sp.]
MVYEMTIAGCRRALPLCPVGDELMIAAFNPFGDVELTCACARELLKIAPEFDYLIAPEAKAIPIIHEMARQSGRNDYILARKAAKLYMRDVFDVEVRSITTAAVQHLYIDGADAEKMRGRRILIIDDVISTGQSLQAVESLVKKAGGIVAGRMSVLAEGDAAKRDDILYLHELPLFDTSGKPLSV